MIFATIKLVHEVIQEELPAQAAFANIDVTVQSRVPLPGLKEAMAAAVKAFADAPERAPSEAKLSSLDR